MPGEVVMDAGLLKRKKALWAGLGGALIPLLILLMLQYRWLHDLDRQARRARDQARRNYINLVAEKTENMVIANAELTIDLPADMLLGNPEKLAEFLKSRSGNPNKDKKLVPDIKKIRTKAVSGIRLIFVAHRDHEIADFFFDPQIGQTLERAPEDLAKPLNLEIYYWRMLGSKHGVSEGTGLLVKDEYNPPMIVKPLLGEDGGVRGVAGMVLDLEYFQKNYLPRLITKTLSIVLPGDNHAVTITDSMNQVIYRKGKAEEDEPLRRSLAPVFSNWHVNLHSREPGWQELAATSFFFNMCLTLGLVLVLTCAASYAALFAFLRLSRWGIRMRAAGQNPLLAAQRGIGLHGVYAIAWGLATFTGGMAGMLIACDAGLEGTMVVLGLKAFPAALVGGLDSLAGALVGALVIAAAEVLMVHHVDPLLSDVVPFLVLLVMLIVRPWGLFGSREELDRV